MTKHDVIARLKNEQGDRSLRTFAADIGEDPAVLSKVYNGERDPSPRVLAFLGLEKREKKIIEYVRK
jgi:hypothetical protein